MPHDPDIAALLSRAHAAFHRAFGTEPTHAAAAPGRVNLIGEHTDYNDGFVLPMAIDRWCVAVSRPRETDGPSRVLAVDRDASAEFDVTSPLSAGRENETGIAPGSWASYIAGVAAQVQRTGRGPRSNFDLAVTSSVPYGGGLSSSASLEVSVGLVLLAMAGAEMAPLDVALLCQKAEHEFAGVPCGIMDQLTSTRGREGHALLIDCRSLAVEDVPLPPPEQVAVLVVNSGVRHELAAGEYAERRAVCAAAARKLGVGSLREAAVPFPPAAGLSEQEGRCARHVVTENARALAASDMLRMGRLRMVGQLMSESHASLRDDYRVSCAELDTLVEAAGAGDGVYGARMTGGGFGGCVVALVEREAVEGVIERVSRKYRAAHKRECACFVVRAVGGARALHADGDPFDH